MYDDLIDCERNTNGMGICVKKGVMNRYRSIVSAMRLEKNVYQGVPGKRNDEEGKGIATTRCWISPPAYKKGIGKR